MPLEREEQEAFAPLHLATWGAHLTQAYKTAWVMHLTTARIHPLCRLWLENRLHHTVQSSSQAFHCKQATAGQTALFWGRAGLGFDTVRGHLGPTGGMTKTSAMSCHTSKGLMNRGSFHLCALLSPPGPLSSSQHKTVWALSGPN